MGSKKPGSEGLQRLTGVDKWPGFLDPQWLTEVLLLSVCHPQIERWLPAFSVEGPGSIPGWGTEILQDLWQSQKNKKEAHSS